MNRSSNVRFAKPVLEQLEGRDMPSFLLSGAVSQLAAPLVAMNNDLASASTNLKGDFSAIFAAHSTGQAELALGLATSDWQRMLNAQHSIVAVSAADTAFVSAAATTEFQNGDALDLIVLNFGGLFGLHPTSALTDPVSQANTAVNDSTIQHDVNVDLFNAPFISSHFTLAQVATPPGF